jgi:hypothetical protein
MWPTAIANHFSAGLPFKHEWAVHAQVRDFNTGALVNKGVWTGDYDLGITLDGLARTYDGAQGGLSVGTITYRIGTTIQTLDIDLALSPEGVAIVRGYDTKKAPCDVFCLGYDARTMVYLGARRFFKGFISGSKITTAEEGGTDKMSIRVESIARNGVMTTTGKKSHQSQLDRDATDQFRKYSDLGTVSNDEWGNIDE